MRACVCVCVCVIVYLKDMFKCELSEEGNNTLPLEKQAYNMHFAEFLDERESKLNHTTA